MSLNLKYRENTTNHSSFNNKMMNDYLAFFTTPEGADMLPYAYMESSDNYDNLIKYNSDYYLFNDEVQIIKQNKDLFTKYLSGIESVVEIGPGSDYAIEHKTLPILHSTKNLKTYCAIDISTNYLDDACNFIRNHYDNIEILGVEADILQPQNIELEKIHGRKVVLFLGSTLGNFNHNQQIHIVKQLSHLTKINDILILTADNNQDEECLLKAYTNSFTKLFLLGILKFFSRIDCDFKQYIAEFDVQCKWEKDLQLIDICFVSKTNISFRLENYGNIEIKAGQEFRGIKTRKPSVNSVIKLLNDNNFSVLETFDNSNKMHTFLCKKI